MHVLEISWDVWVLQKHYLVPQLVLAWEKPEQINISKFVWCAIKRN